ncbi:MAG: DUF211 domain-containing protein [Sulfolobales archaeon]
MPLKKIVLDVLKTIKGTSLVELAEMIVRLNGVSRISINVSEVDVETITLNVTIEGNSIDFSEVRDVIEKAGGVIHSIDYVIAEKD